MYRDRAIVNLMISPRCHLACFGILQM